MAVEMAKLSIWLITVARDRPFTFLDHAIRHGDLRCSGIISLDQSRNLHLYAGECLGYWTQQSRPVRRRGLGKSSTSRSTG